jgi:hypothetical protein
MIAALVGSDRWKKLPLAIRGREGAAKHAVGLGVIGLLALWLMRRLLFSSAFPAGTDMLGFISRAQENASWGQIFNVWSPSSLGAPRQFTLDNVLGLLTMLTGDPVVSVKLLAFTTLVASGAFTYMLAWRWYSNTCVATLAGLLYMTSQASLSRWGSGQLNIEMAIAAAPLIVYLWAECIDAPTMRRALIFSLGVSALMLVRLDMILYVAPFLGLYVVIRAVAAPRPGLTGRNLIATTRVALPATITINLYQIVPALGGVRASWLSTGHLFDVNELVDRSLGAYSSLLGFGRELGYLAFTGQQTWFSHPWVALWIYLALASVTVGIAYSAVWRHREPRTLFLLAAALLATFLAKGVRDPLGAPYLWSVDHLPIFGNLRGPNRWLIVQALSYSLLAAIGVDHLVTWLSRRWTRARESRRPLVALAAAGLIAALLVPVGPTLVSGFRTWRPDAQQVALMKRVARDDSSFRVATVPYDQTIRFLDQGSYHGFEHDLGAESPIWTRRAAIGDGGWNQRAADFVAYSSSLLRQADPAYQELLGAVGTKYLVKFNYPATSAHLQSLKRPLYQQHAVADMPGFARMAKTDRGDLYALKGWSPMVSFRPNMALILGGGAGLASLANLRGIDMRAWAAVTADDALDRGGLVALLKLVHEANLILLGDEQLQDLAVQASAPVARVPGITSGPELDRKTQLLPSDGSTRSGSLSDKSIPPPGAKASAAATLRIQGSSKQLELWVRVKTGPTAGTLRLQVDGKTVRELTPLAVEAGGFRWLNARTMAFAPGAHRIAVEGTRSAYGQSFEVDEARLVEPVDRRAALAKLTGALGRAKGKIAYSLDLDDAQKWSPAQDYFSPADTIGDPTSFWRPVDTGVAGTPRAGTVSINFTGRRKLYTFAYHNFSEPQDWTNRPYISLRYRGTGSGRTYLFIVDFDKAGRNSAVYSFVDSGVDWQTRAFSLPTPIRREGRTGWPHVVSLRLAANSKSFVGSGLQLGALRLSHALTQLPLTYPVLPSSRRRTAMLTSSRGGFSRDFARIPAFSAELSARLPHTVLGEGFRLVVPPTAPLRQYPAVPVRFRQTSPTNYDFSFTSRRPGVLVLSQGYHPKWSVSSKGAGGSSLPVFSATNGFVFGPGGHSGSIGFKGQRFAWWGLTLTLAALAGIVFLLVSRRRESPPETPSVAVTDFGSRNGHIAIAARPRHFVAVAVASGFIVAVSPLAAVLFLMAVTLVLRPAWWIPWLGGLGLLAVAPIAVALDQSVSLDDVSFLFVVFMTIGLGLLVRDVRHAHPRPVQGAVPGEVAHGRAAPNGAKPRTPVVSAASVPPNGARAEGPSPDRRGGRAT